MYRFIPDSPLPSGCTTFDINAIRLDLLPLCLAAPAAMQLSAAGTSTSLYGHEAGQRECHASIGCVSLGVMFVTVGCPALSNWALFQLPLSICLCLTSVGPLYAIPMSYFSGKSNDYAIFGSLVVCGGVVVLYSQGR